jgi:F0F1-type ATP synthase assembly protein I
MNPLKEPAKGNRGKGLAQAGVFLVIPTILLVAPMIGYFIGNWADSKLGTEPYLLIVGLLLGFGAAAREIYNLIKKAQAIGEEKDIDSDGT